jgi:hypothetical protein
LTISEVLTERHGCPSEWKLLRHSTGFLM